MSEAKKSAPLTPELTRLVEARHHDPFQVLGAHRRGGEALVRVFKPDAERVTLENGEPMHRLEGTDLFEWRGPGERLPPRYKLHWLTREGGEREGHDAYAFGPQIADFDLHLFGEGRHRHVYRVLGAHPHLADGVPGVLFATWAPNAERVSVVGDFNRWDGRAHPMRVRGGSGVWELFVPDLSAGERYKFEVRSRHGAVVLKADPYAQHFEVRPDTASLVPAQHGYHWGDGEWMEARAKREWLHAPMSVYEVHLGSWARTPDNRFLGYRELAERLVDYVREMGFTHIELLPVTEHPLDASWGYQTIGYFAPTSRFGSPDDLRWFVEHCHRNGIGVLMDWAPGHFPRDAHGLARFDGTALYEHEDPRRGEHQDWGTLIFNYGRNEVRNFLLASAVYWLEEFHIDGLRVDAVASMLYLDYSRGAGEWIPNEYGGNENLDAIAFLRELNTVTQGQHPGALMIAEESTAWPQVTRPTWVGGLGFSMKWNMGWMHDTLDYLAHDPVYRGYHHDRLTFGLLYAFTENFVLPFSHDEVVHGKGSMLGKMPGDDWQRRANLRLLYTYMWSYPGKKLLFMGCELAQPGEWDHDRPIDWTLLDDPGHAGMRDLVRDLNRLYRDEPALHAQEFEPAGFDWIDCHDSAQSVLNYVRRGAGRLLVVALNFTPVPRHGYRIGVPAAGHYREVLNSDSALYGGSDVGNGGGVHSEPTPWMGHPHSLVITLPPLAGVLFAPEPPQL